MRCLIVGLLLVAFSLNLVGCREAPPPPPSPEEAAKTPPVPPPQGSDAGREASFPK